MASAYKNLGNFEVANEGTIPSPAPIFVSLYIILISFFVMMTKDLDLSSNHSNDAFRSVKEKFGKPEDEVQSYTQLVKPKFNDFVHELEKIFLTEAVIESSVNGDRTNIISSRDFYFYGDEIYFKPQHEILIGKLQNLLVRWNNRERIIITYKIGLVNYEQDKMRLKRFTELTPNIEHNIALDSAEPDKITIIIEVVQ